MNDLNLGWLIGIIEGEGYLGVVSKRERDKTYYTPSIAVSMIDKDSVEKLKEITQIGKINGPYQRQKGKPFWTWQVCKQKEVITFCLLLYPHMSERRKSRIKGILLHYGIKCFKNTYRFSLPLFKFNSDPNNKPHFIKI